MSLLPLAAPAHPLAPDLLRLALAERSRHLAFVRRQMPSSVDPEDVLQLALLRATQHLGELRQDPRLDAWFWTILRRTILDERERHARERLAREQLREQANEAVQPAATTCACSLALLHELRPAYRQLLERVDLREEPLDHVARDAGISVLNATVRLHRARKALREALRGRCGTDSARACHDCRCGEAPARA